MASPSRLEASLFLMQAVEARFPRLIPRKPILAGVPLDLFSLHQAVLFFGGYRVVEKAALWSRVAEQILPLQGPVSSLKTSSFAKQPEAQLGFGARDPSSSLPPQAVAQIRDKALRYLAWIEDEAPSSRVVELQTIAKLYPMKLIPFESLTPNLQGGNVQNDLGEWTFEPSKKDHCQDLSVSCGIPGIIRVQQKEEIEKSSSVTANGEEESRKRDRLDEGATDAIFKRRKGIDIESSVASNDVASSNSDPPGAAIISSNYLIPDFVRIVDVNAIHSDDANRLYKLYSIEDMLIGAYATHTNPVDITVEEEIAFPHYSRAANASTVYSESQRRDTLRSNNAVLVIPSQGDTSDSIIIFALAPESDVNAIGAALMADKPLPLSMPVLKVPSSGLGVAPTEGSNLSVLNNIIHSLSNQTLRISSAPPVPRALMKIEDYLAITSSIGPGGGVSTQTVESKKKSAKFDPLSKRIAEGVEHEPHVGLSVTRVQFLLDLRNHILLKWVQSQSTVEEKDYKSRREDALRAVSLNSSTIGCGSTYSTTSSLFQEACKKSIGSTSPTHPAWNASMLFKEIGEKKSPASTQQIQRSVGARKYILPGPLMLREVLRTIPSRFHEAAAAVFDFLEGQAKINIGAISYRLDETQNDRDVPCRIPWEVLFNEEALPFLSSESGQTPIKMSYDKLTGPPSPPFKRKRVAVIGAGISGLAAARQLSFFGHEVVVIEAQDRPGGRIRTERGKLGQPVDEGAMISTGSEPNPFSLISRQLNLRTHEISNLEAPLLLPQSLRARVNEMSSAREKRAKIVAELKKRAVLQQDAQTQARNAVHAAALAAARARESLYSDVSLRKEITSDLLSYEIGNVDHGLLSSSSSSSLLSQGDFGISLPQDLNHIPDAITAQVLRVYSAHAAFIAEHVNFLERVLKFLTSLSVAQFASRSECFQYGVVRLNQPHRSLPLATKQMLECVHNELQKAKNWLTEPISRHVIDMIRSVSHDQLDDAKKRSATLLFMESHSQPSKNIDDVQNVLMTDYSDHAPFDVSPSSLDSAGVVLVPQSIDAEVAEDHNALLERAHQFRLKEVAPALNECLFSYPLLRGDDPINFVPLVTTPASPPGFVISGHELIRVTETQPAGRPNPNDPWTFSFASGSDGGLLGCGIKTWTTDVYPRRRANKYTDPRRTDDDVDGAFEHLDRVPGQASAVLISKGQNSHRVLSAVNPQPAHHSLPSLPNSSQSVIPLSSQPRKIIWGSRPSWDCSLGLALEMMTTADDAERVTCGGLRPDLASAVAALRLTSTDGDDTLDRLLSSSLALKVCDADTDGLMAGGSSSKKEHQDELTFAALRRALLRWHAANLEYGCARPLSEVSLQSWDQDDVFGYHDKGRHTFSRDGYDTHVRGMVQGLSVLYNSEVVKIKWSEDGSSEARVTIKSPVERKSGSTESESSHHEDLTVDAVIVTLPIGVLQERHESLFDPPLPKWKVDAIQGLNPGLLNKVMIRFPKAFWRKTSSVSDVKVSTKERKNEKEEAAALADSEKKTELDETRSSNVFQQSPLSYLPLMESLTSLFHLQHTFLSDSRLVSACSLALAASESDLIKSTNKSPSEILFSSIQSFSETSKLKTAALELRDKLMSSRIDTVKSLDGEYGSNKTYKDAELVAERIFAIPSIPNAGAATPSHLSPAAAAAAKRAAELADVEVSLKKETVDIIGKLLKNTSDPLQRSRSEMRANGISSVDDAFCRVVLGDDTADVRRRGESYMFWAMDRPGEGAKLKLVVDTKNNPFKDGQNNFDFAIDDSEGAVLIAMMAGAAAEWVEEVSDNVAIQSVMSTLRELFGAEIVPEPESYLVTRWRSNAFARGSYSSLAPGSHGSTYDILAAPINRQDIDSEGTLPALFFAGEATNRHHPTTAAGAFDTGVREAVRISSVAGRARDPDVLRILAAREMRIGKDKS